MPSLECPPPFTPHTSGWKSWVGMLNDDRKTTMSPRLHQQIHPTVHLETASAAKLSDYLNTEKEQSFGSVSCLLKDKTTYKSSKELVEELATLETEISHLERYILSRYRSAFEHHFPRLSGHDELNEQPKNSAPPLGMMLSDQPSQLPKFRKINCYKDYTGQIDTPSTLSCSRNSTCDPIPKVPLKEENKNAYSYHRSLAYHFGNPCENDTLIFANKLSEEIVICISSIYCKLATPSPSHKVYSACSYSSWSSSTFSPRNLSGSWSPHCSDDTRENCDFEVFKQDNGSYSSMIEVLKIRLDYDTYGYAASMLQKFRSLVKSLENIDLTKMRREEKLAFWLNIHNALVMHAYLAYGTQNYIKSTSIIKASYNVGGHCINAYDIQSSILGIRSHYSAPWLQTFITPGKKFKSGVSRHVYAVEFPEPLVHFALSSGAFSDPVVRVYKANTIFQDLKVAKQEYIQAMVYVHKETKIYLPKILCCYGKDVSLDMTALLTAVSECLSGIQQKAVIKFAKGRPEKHVCWLDQTSSFRYLIHKDIAARRE